MISPVTNIDSDITSEINNKYNRNNQQEASNQSLFFFVKQSKLINVETHE